ncbi:MAG: hypothetical protein NZM31_05645 [Gemmatales bacterium]|nr:hypothetical protein [Gemmatales bacterium]MDW8386482.1 hypothetical protein [Gemmatales bacterium]
MAWQVGLDEAGYGPNLGPFVMTLAALQLPDAQANADPWKVLRDVVRRPEDPPDDRLLVADSKQIHTGNHGLDRLEANTLPFVLLQRSAWRLPLNLETAWRGFCLTPWAERLDCPWADAGLRLPLCQSHDNPWLCLAAKRLDDAMRKRGVTCLTFRWLVIMPERFNRLTQAHGTKAAVTQWAATRLLRTFPRFLRSDEDRIVLHADKQGGRHYYGELLQQAWPDRFVAAVEEHPEAARYRILKGGSEWEAVFRPRAESASFVVALASMLSKYLREVLMHEFNSFWCSQVPRLRPTAGYPKDAQRFLAEIEVTRQRLRIPQQMLWRER